MSIDGFHWPVKARQEVETIELEQDNNSRKQKALILFGRSCKLMLL